MRQIRSFQICESSNLVLSIAWDPSSDHKSSIAISLSNGKVGVLSYEPSKHTLDLVQAHSLEAWTAQWSEFAETDSIANVYSGGDDSMICRHRGQLEQQQQVDIGEPEDDTYRPLSQNKKIHTAGVTAILATPIREGTTEILLTGSYDEYLRVVGVDLLNRSWKLLAEERLHGGVWKLQAFTQIEEREDGTIAFGVIASCMHAGVKVLDIWRSSRLEWSITMFSEFEEHGSMSYASDARRSLPNEGTHNSLIVVSTSFYDKKLCVWHFDYALPTP